LPENIRNSIDPQNLQPPIIQSLRLDSDVTLSEPIALNSSDAGLLSITSLSIKELALAWGNMSVSVIGDVSPDEVGVLDGSITITARNWQQALSLAVASGVLEDDRIFLVTEIANNFDETPHIPDTLTVTLSIVNGEMVLGGFALGPAPLLR
jgi:hypothetical protein